MKYNDFKIFKFSTILKKINHIKDNFIKGYKDIKSIPSNIAEFFIPFLKSIYNGINKILKFLLRDLIKIFKSLIENIYSFFRAIKYFNIRRYNYSKIYILNGQSRNGTPRIKEVFINPKILKY